jgi:SAM-dependent methyltransferase
VTYVVDGIWNHNIHHSPVLLRAVPHGCRRALDVGCGQGFLLPGLAARADHVVGIDRDAPSLAEAAERVTGLPGVELVAGDAMTYEFEEPFDAVVSVAVLHHLPLVAGLERLAALTRPGGVVGVVGLANSRGPRDLLMDAVGAVDTRVRRLRRPHTMVAAPISDPVETYAQVREAARSVLPGARFRRHPLFRYSLVWTKPRD